MRKKHESRSKANAMLMLVAAIFFLMVVTHATIASQGVERWFAMACGQFGNNGDEPVVKLNSSNLPASRVEIPIDAQILTSPRGGVYVYNSPNNDGIAVVLGKAYRVALGQYPQTFGWYMPLPFLIPFAAHLGVVWILPMCTRFEQGWKALYQSNRSFGMHALIAAVYAYLITVFFQSARMFWGSKAWDGAYFVSYRYGWTAFYLFFGLCIAMYLYCVIGTAGLQVRRKPTAKKQTCIKCGYELAGIEGNCPECDLEIGAFVPSKLRINHWYLAAMFVVTFFSPVLVESVYSILG